jgi:hypothetical protein
MAQGKQREVENMRSNAKVKEGYHRRAYPENRLSRGPVTYQHINDPAGRTFLIYVQMVGDQLTEGTSAYIFDRDFVGAGLGKQKLFDAVVARLPFYPTYYRQVSGRDLTPLIVYKRWHNKVVYTNGKTGTKGQNKPAQSREHYSSSERLRRCVPAVEEAFRRGGRLTLQQMRELGTL